MMRFTVSESTDSVELVLPETRLNERTKERFANDSSWRTESRELGHGNESLNPPLVDADCVTATRQVLSQFQGSFKCGLRMQPSFPGVEGCIGCILHGPTYPKILHGPTYPSQDSLRIQSMEMAENGDLSSAFKCKYLVSNYSSI